MPPFRASLCTLVIGVALATGACGQTVTDPSNRPAPLEALPRSLTVAEQKLIGAANAFTFALLEKTSAAERGTNVFISPLSASFALGMTMNGAASQTFDEMRAALQATGATQQEINDGYKSLIALLTTLDPAVQMQIANSIWYRAVFPFLPEFLDAGKTYFDAEVRGLNFDDAAGSLSTINGWVDNKTNGRIQKILEVIRAEDVMFLINAIYFKGSWRDKFDPAQTRDTPFQALDGTRQPMKLMHRLGKLSYAETPAWQAVDLPYGNSAFSMTVLLPKAGTDFESVAGSLTPASWRALTEGMTMQEVDFSLPKLRLSYERMFNDDLKALGMRRPFIPGGADFTRMSTMGNELFISFVKQKAFVDINEEGTEAAAVTVVGIGVTSAPVVPVMRVDRPYLFAIRERLTGTLLFVGKIVRMPA